MNEMTEQLINYFAPISPEENDLLRGGKLQRGLYGSAFGFTVESSRFLPERQMITLRPHTRFVDFPMHSHDYVEMMYVLAGHTKHLLQNGEQVQLGAGELLMINRNASHAIERTGLEDIAVNFLVQPIFFDYALELIGTNHVLGRFLLDALRSGESEVPYLHFRIAGDQSIQALLVSMIQTLLTHDQGNQRIKRTQMGLLFMQLLQLPESMQISHHMRGGNTLVVEFLQEIQRNYQSLQMSEFAARHRVSCAYLSRVVKQAMNQTGTELLQQRRLQKAKQLLRDTNLSILEICAAVGYNNSSHFYRLFEKNVGMPPRAYRSSHRS